MKYVAHAKPWEGGWELHVDGVGVTQVKHFKDAEQQIRDYLQSALDADVSASDIEVVTD